MSDQNPEKPPRNPNKQDGPNMPGLKMGRSLLTWMLVIGLAVMLLMLFNQSDRQSTQIPFSEFDQRLKSGELKTVVIEGDEILGEFRNAQTIAVNGNNVQVTKFRTRAAADGAQAVAAVARETFDLIVTDYNMPYMDGRGLVGYLKQNPSTTSQSPIQRA